MRDTSRWPVLVVTVAAVLSGVAAVVISSLVFPHLSINNDEPIYRLQAQALAHGHLFPPAPDPASSYTPWLATLRHGHYVLKYTPVVPALFGASLAATGSFAPGLGLIAALSVVVTYLLAVELLGDRRVAALAAVLWALSPLVIVQSALLLPYVPFVVLIELAVLGVLRGLRLRRARPVVLGGFALGLAVVARQFDAVVFVLPLAVGLAIRERRRLGWLIGWLVAGGLVPALGLLAFNTVATGSPLKLPFALLEPSDKLGYGIRKLYPTDFPHQFGFSQGLDSVGSHLWLLAIGWVTGGVVLAVFAIVTVVRRRAPAPAALLGLGALVMIVAYLFFWGGWNAATLWGGIRFQGPFYFLPLLVPLVVLGSRGVADLWAVRSRITVAASGVLGAAALAVVAITLVASLSANAAMTRNDDRLTALIREQGRSLVFYSAAPTFLQHPTAVVGNGWRPEGRTVYSLVTGSNDLRVADTYADRAQFRLRILGSYNRTPHTRFVVWLERARRVTAPEVQINLSALPPGDAISSRLVLASGGRRLSYDVDPQSTTRATLRLTPAGPELVGAGAPTIETGPVADKILRPDLQIADPGEVVVALLAKKAHGREFMVEADRLPLLRAPNGQVSTVAPDGLVKTLGKLGNPAIEMRLADQPSP